MMWFRRPWRIRSVAILGLLAVLSACNYRLGWVKVTSSDRMRASDALFDGQSGTAIDLAAGEKMSPAYNLEITKGSLSLQMPLGNCWQGVSGDRLGKTRSEQIQNN